MVPRIRRPARLLLAAVALPALIVATGNPSPAQTGKKKAPPTQTGKKKGAAPATVVDVSGVLLERGAKGKTWRSLRAKDAVPAGATVIALPEAELRSGNKAVGLKMLADVGRRLKLPVFEAAVVVHDNPKADLDFTLDRGVVVLTNLRTKGKATVRLRFRDQAWQVVLKEPGTKVGVEMYGRYPTGLPEPVKKDAEVVQFKNVPTNDLLLFVLQGQVYVDAGTQGLQLKAPPGKALVHWDSIVGFCDVKHVAKMPEEVGKPPTDEEKKKLQLINAYAQQLLKGSLKDALDRLMQAKDERGPRVAVVVAGAVDDLPRLTAALADPRGEVRDQAVLVLRNWLGRRPGQADKLFAALTRDGYSRIQAGTVLFLLFGPTDQHLAQPAVYDVLIAKLGSDKMAIRELAHWHLVRLVPAGKEIAFDPAGPEEARQKAAASWRRLIPPGQLPPAPPKTEDKK
jgi:hypothetical protein